MNILILTQWFDPEPNNMKALAFAKGLKDRGHMVTVLTGFPNYPTGKLFSGYHLKLYQKETLQAIPIHRVFLYPNHDSSSIRRIINYTSFAFFAALIGPWVVKGKIDVIYVYHPPATVMLPALILRFIKKAGILLDINDLWPDTIISTGMLKQKCPLKMITAWMNYSYRKADRINVLSAGVKAFLVERHVSPDKISIIPVWCNENLLKEPIQTDFRKQFSLQDCFLGIYAGAMGRAQNLTVLLAAAEIMQTKLPDFKLLLIGNGICLKELQELVHTKKLNNVIFIPVLPPEKLTGILYHADVLFVQLKKDPLFAVTIPSKTAYYLSLGKPIIAGLSGDAARMLEASKGSIVCEPEAADEIAAAILRLYQMDLSERNAMGACGREYYRKYLSMDAGIMAFEKELYIAAGLSNDKAIR